jgi:GNAT superfamily N-acetyltransferase
LTLVTVLAVAVAVVLPLLAYKIHADQDRVWLPALLVLLALLTVLYVWRFGLRPLVRSTGQELVVKNPFRTRTFSWDDVTLVAPGENGLVIGSRDGVAEAWCIQKSHFSSRRGRTTRADRIAAELLNLLDEKDPPVVDARSGLRIRRARPDESPLLSRLEQAASEAEFAHVFPPETYPYPTTEVTSRWHALLRDRLTRVHILELVDAPVGFVAFNADTVLHLGVVPGQMRRGRGSALLDYATQEMFAWGIPAAQLWVMTDNQKARTFYRARGWSDTDEHRDCEFPPHPPEVKMTKGNPRAPRRRLAS